MTKINGPFNPNTNFTALSRTGGSMPEIEGLGIVEFDFVRTVDLSILTQANQPTIYERGMLIGRISDNNHRMVLYFKFRPATPEAGQSIEYIFDKINESGDEKLPKISNVQDHRDSVITFEAAFNTKEIHSFEAAEEFIVKTIAFVAKDLKLIA